MAKDLTDLKPVIDQMHTLLMNIEQLQERYQTLRDMVIEQLGDEGEGVIDGQTVATYKTFTARKFSTSWLKDTMPDVYEAGRREQTTTRFQLVTETRNA